MESKLCWLFSINCSGYRQHMGILQTIRIGKDILEHKTHSNATTNKGSTERRQSRS